MHQRCLQTALLLIVFTLSSKSHAEQIILTNGDTLSGKLAHKSASELVWASDNFGALTIELWRVISIDGALQSVDTKPMVRALTKPSPSYSGALSLTGSTANGNQSRRDWDLDTKIQRRDLKMRHTGQLEYESHTLKDDRVSNNYNISYSNDWFYTDRWFWRNEASLGADETRSIAKTYTIGSALGHQFWDNPDSSLSLESGILWIAEDLENGTSDDHLTWSWSLDYSHTFFQRIELFHSQEIRVSMRQARDSQADIDIGIKLPLIANLFTELKFEWLYDNQPALNTRALDSQFSMGINYAW